MVGDCEELVKRLGARVGPPAAMGGAHDDVAVLAEREFGRFPVNLACGGDEAGDGTTVTLDIVQTVIYAGVAIAGYFVSHSGLLKRLTGGASPSPAPTPH